jgi:acetylglutamate synthase
MSEKRKKALVIYMAALFGIAFLIVSISLSIQMKKNTVNATSAEKVIALQNELQQLKTENKELQSTLSQLETDLTDVLNGIEYLEGKAYESTARINGQERLLEINAMVIAYQQAVIDQDEEAKTKYLEELKEAARDAQPLDSNLYQTIKSIITENESETDE